MYNDTIQTMRRRLEQFPADLESYFRHMIDSVPKIYLHETAQTFRIALSRDEPFLMMTYAYLDEVDDSNQYNPVYDKVTTRLSTMRRRLDGRCKGLLEIVEQRSRHKGRLERYHVEFLHRTVRDYLTHNEDMQDFVRKETTPEGKLWIKACSAAYRTLAHRSSPTSLDCFEEVSISEAWGETFHFAFLAKRESRDPSAASEILNNISRIAARGFDYRARICLACEYGLADYVRHEVSEWFSDSPDLLKGGIGPLINLIIPHTLKANRVSGELSPELVKYLLSLGADPYTLAFTATGSRGEKVGSISLQSPFTDFFDSIKQGVLSVTGKGVWEVTQLLFTSVEMADQPEKFSQCEQVKEIIRQKFTRPQFLSLYTDLSGPGQGSNEVHLGDEHHQGIKRVRESDGDQGHHRDFDKRRCI